MGQAHGGSGAQGELVEFASRFWEVMSGEAEEIRALNKARYWEYVGQLSHLRRAIDEAGDGNDPETARRLLTIMRRVLDGFGGRRADPEPTRRDQSVEERRWYVQWSDFSGHRREGPASEG